MKDFTGKLYVDLTSKQYINRVIEVKIEDENYTEFIEVFLNEYITFYSVKLYKDINNEFVINDISHKLILLYILVIKIQIIVNYIQNLQEETDIMKKLKILRKCKYCKEPIGKDGESNSFYERKSYYKIFKNDEDLENENKNKKHGKCMTLDKFYEEFIAEKLENDSKGLNLSKKGHFDKMDKPIRNQSQIGFRLMYLFYILTYLQMRILKVMKKYLHLKDLYIWIKGNWEKLKILLNNKGINIYIFMNLTFKDLFNFLNKQKQIDNYEKLLEIEKEIENIIENKIFKKTEKIKEKELTKYEVFANFYSKQKEVYREKKNSKEMNSPDTYNEEE